MYSGSSPIIQIDCNHDSRDIFSDSYSRLQKIISTTIAPIPIMAVYESLLCVKITPPLSTLMVVRGSASINLSAVTKSEDKSALEHETPHEVLAALTLLR